LNFRFFSLGPLARKVHEQHVQDIIAKLSNHILNEKAEETRDIASTGLKTVISEIPSDSVNIVRLIVKTLIPKLIGAIGEKESASEIVSICLDILNDLLVRFGSELSNDYEKIQKVVMAQLLSPKSSSRKKAISCLSRLSVLVSEKQFEKIMDLLLDKIDSSKKADHIRTLISAVGAVCRAVGHRASRKISRIMPHVLEYVDHPDFTEDDELRESCFQTFEALILRCPKEVTPYLQSIIDFCLRFIKYDPNYAGDLDEEAMDTGSEEGGDEGEGEDFSDDDDVSWKVRKGSSRCLAALIQTRPEMLKDIYEKIAPVLIARFKEREENVKLDIFATFSELVKQTAAVSTAVGEEKDTPLGKLRALIPKFVAGIQKELKQKSVKTRIGVFNLLKEIVQVLPGAFNEHTSTIIPAITDSLSEKISNSPLKIETLEFLRCMLATHSPAVIQPHIKTLAPHIFTAVSDPYYKVSAEALRVCCELVKTLRPNISANFDYKPYVKDLYKVTLEKLKQMDVDQVVKEGAINAMGLIISNFSDELKSQLDESLKLLLDRLKNEITRLTAVRAFVQIASSSLRVDLTSVLGDVLMELATFLRKQNRQLKQSALSALIVFVQNYGKEKAMVAMCENILKEAAALINDADLHLSHLALKLVAFILQSNPAAASAVQSIVLPHCLELLKSSLLQGLALESMLALFQEMVKTNTKQLSFESLLEAILNVVHKHPESSGPLARQAYSSVAQCVAVLTATLKESARNATVERFINDAKSGRTESVRLLAFYCLGEIGRRTDLSNSKEVKNVVFNAMETANSEDIKSAASIALGNIAIGNLEKFLPDILSEVNKNPKKKYLLLGSLREVIVRQSGTKDGANRLLKFFDQLLGVLFENMQSEEEGTRNVVAECLGKLAVVHPDQIIPALKERVSNKNAFIRSTVISALKYTIAEQHQPIDAILQKEMPTFLELLKDSNIEVRRATLLTLNYAAHHKPKTIRDILPKYLPILFNETKIKPELIRTVDLGPFKHQVDDGLELRKAAFEVMYTLLDTLLDRLDIQEFIKHMVDGLKDQPDIVMLNQLMLIRLAHREPVALLAGLDYLVEPLRTIVTTKAKDNAVKQQIERNEELIRSALRAIATINRIPNVDTNQKWVDFIKTTVKGPDLAAHFEQVCKELAENRLPETAADAMDVS